MAKLHFVDQGTEGWWRLRRGIPTASQFARIITPGGRASDQARPYMYKLIAERLLGETMEERPAVSQWVEHGAVTEAAAIEKFQQRYNLILDQIGFVTTDDGRIGASPDALVKGSVECVEIKCPAPWTQIGYLLDGPDDKYKPQVQGQLFVGEWEFAHFFSYHPRMPSVYRRTRRDEPYIAMLARTLDKFCDQLDEGTERARGLGVYGFVERVTTDMPGVFPWRSSRPAS